MPLKVNFDRSIATYVPGEIVKGTLDLVLKEPLHTSSITVILKGTAFTQWKKLSLSTVNCARESVTVWSDGSKKPQLNTGKYMFSFRLRLPANCPPTFKGKHGEIVYEISVELDRKWPFKVDNIRSFRVLHFADLNTVPMAKSPIRLEKKKKGVSVILSIPKRGFVSGEIIPVFCDVNNDSSKPIVMTKVKLYKRISYRVGNMTASVEEEVLTKARKKLAIPPMSRFQVKFFITVPRSTFPTLDMTQCSAINIDYFLEIKFTSKSLFNSQIKLSPTMLIGAVPVIVLEPYVPLERIAGLSEKNEENNNDTKEASSSTLCIPPFLMQFSLPLHTITPDNFPLFSDFPY